MRRLLLLLSTLWGTVLLTSCSSPYSVMQTDQQRHSPVNCNLLHMKGAVWDYLTPDGSHMFVTGACLQGRRNGTFKYSVDGWQVAKVKFSMDREIKTTCLATGRKTRVDLQQCLELAFQSKKTAQ